MKTFETYVLKQNPDPGYFYLAVIVALKMTKLELEFPLISYFWLEKLSEAKCVKLHITMQKLIINTWKIMIKQKNHGMDQQYLRSY